MTQRGRFHKTIHWILTILIGIYLTILSLAYFGQNNLIYVGTSLPQSAAYDTSTYSVWLNDWFEPIGFKSAIKGSTEIWLCFHGNGERAEVILEEYLGLRSIIQDAKIDIYVMEYPGYGSRKGRLSEQNLVSAGLEAIDLLSKQPKPLYVMGQSLGSGVSCLAISQKIHKVAGYVMITPFTSMQDAARSRFFRQLNILSFLFPVEWLVKDRYRNIAYLKEIPCPTAILACQNDTTTPYWMAQKLQSSRPDTLLKTYPGDHSVPLTPAPETVAAFNFARGK